VSRLNEIDLKNLSRILIDGIADKGIDIDIRKKILSNIESKHYNVACDVLNQASDEYFRLGLEVAKTLKEEQ